MENQKSKNNDTEEKDLIKSAELINVNREDPCSIDLREYRFIPKLKIVPKKRSDIYEKMFPGIG